MSRQSTQPQQLTRYGDIAFENSTKVSGELFAVTYGATVNMLLEDAGGLSPSSTSATLPERCAQVNDRLRDMGVRIGFRLVDDFLAKSGAPPCRGFERTVDTVARVAFRMFLGVRATVESGSETTCSIIFDDNPLNGFAELPEQVKGHLWYSNIVCGVIEGGLQLIDVKVRAEFKRCVLRGDSTHEIVLTRDSTAK